MPWPRELKSLFSKHKLPRKGIRLGIASSRVGVRTLEVPAIEDPKLLENAIRFRAQEVLPIPLNDAILDHIVLGETMLDDGPGLRILVAFAHRELIDRYVEAFKAARLKVAAIDFEAFALLRAVANPLNGDGAPSDRATVAVAVGQERTIFAVAGGRCLRLHACARMGRRIADRGHRPRAQPDPVAGRAGQEDADPRGRDRNGSHPRPGRDGP